MFPKLDVIYLISFDCECSRSYSAANGEGTKTNWFDPYHEPTSDPDEGCTEGIHTFLWVVENQKAFTRKGAHLASLYFFAASPRDSFFPLGITDITPFVRFPDPEIEGATIEGAFNGDGSFRSTVHFSHSTEE